MPSTEAYVPCLHDPQVIRTAIIKPQRLASQESDRLEISGRELIGDDRYFTSANEVGLQLYKLWPGKNRFYHGGAIMLGPREDLGFNICLWMFVLVPASMYFLGVAPWLWRDDDRGYGVFVVAEDTLLWVEDGSCLVRS
ncbi:hypothetical protein Pmar_PMAR012594 [Perkinsus marinus ATCC 50983]|uniref:Uncharacterized protein n=1 Tax=Perkinsus marinus (strain ATCC 50983 / TXsc) TaxID=423536 RepID=C5K7S6_PERM5|nr:hypothetical protein Pmar_PMAR012594 [Perkinsus marinus ATCC 50983]EER19611.1 hypothetical protein Pmar_PMAR012594 [Perkinsus marinus ATCC 50983]|eukprot:XP_002787815.1 hypothetical protein Pmar_PMAR012594 [Perkinsus marinus ATCC 50983]